MIPQGARRPVRCDRDCLVAMVTAASFCFWTMKIKRFLIYLFDLKGKIKPLWTANLDNQDRRHRCESASFPARYRASSLLYCGRSFFLW